MPCSAGAAQLIRAAAADPSSGVRLGARKCGLRSRPARVEHHVRWVKSLDAGAMMRIWQREVWAFSCWRHLASVVSPPSASFRLQARLHTSLLRVPHQSTQAKV